MLKIIKKHFSIILLNLFLIVPNVAISATSDCVQTHSDGTFDCFKATSTWSYQGLETQSFEELKEHAVNFLCGSFSQYPFTCHQQETTNQPPLPIGRTCGSSPSCNMSTEIYNTTSNIGGIYSVTYYRTDNNSLPYYQRGGNPYHYRICPQGTTAINPDSTSLRLCKPTKPSSYNKECANGSDKLSCSQQSRGESVVGDPINVVSGAKTLIETDYFYISAHPFVFQRYYTHSANTWRHSYEKQLGYTNTNQGEIITLVRPTFQTVLFKKINGNWEEFRSNYGTKLEQNGNNFTYTNELNEKEFYTNITPNLDNFSVFNLTIIEKPQGNILTLTYSPNGLLTKITDIYANEFNLSYSSQIVGCSGVNKLISIIGPGNNGVNYEYNNTCRISKVKFPDNTFKEYIYNSNALIQVKDENGNIHQLTSYSTITGKGYLATSEGLGTTGIIDKVNLNYNTPNQITLTDSRSNSVVVSNNSNNKITGYNSLCTFCIGIQGSNITYDINGYVSSVTDYKGIVTNYTWNSRGLLLTKTENVGGLLERTSSYTYGTTHNLPLTQTNPVQGGEKVVTYTYDNNLNITAISVTAPKNDGSQQNETRTASLVYNNFGALTEIYGPRYNGGINDKTTITYNSSGQTESITNGLGQVLSFSNFNNYGMPQTIIDSSSRVMLLTYDNRGRVLTSEFKSSISATDGETTTLTYDNAGLLTETKSPSSAYFKMFYDNAQRLIKIEEYNENNSYLGKTEFTLDNMSNVTAIKTYNSSGTQIRIATATYDNKNRLYQAIGALSQTDIYTYDNNSNLTQIVDAGNNATAIIYDALNRLSTQTNPDNGIIGLTYHSDNNVATVTDPKNLVTTYTYNGFGEIIKVNSPDTGTSEIHRDKAGNPIYYKDARGQESEMIYDAINRLINVNYIGAGNENVSITYDNCQNGIGKPCIISDISGTQNYTYNNKGRLESKQYVKGAFNKTVGYQYDSFGRLSNITYPSGKVINYTYLNDKILTVSYTLNGINTNIVNTITYEPFNNNFSSFIWGNSATYSKTINNDGLPTIIYAPNAFSVNKGYIYDSRDNITQINETGQPSRSSIASYDSKSRISNYNYGINGNNIDYTYNTSDDRTNKIVNGITTQFNYQNTSHRLDSLSGGTTDSMIYDANGNTVSATGKTYSYNAANRILTSNDGSITTNYLINFMGQRTKKTNQNSTTWFIYDENNNIIAEYDENNELLNEYIYFDNTPLALIKNETLYYIYTDHLNTPRAITDISNNLQWSWENKEAFGNNNPDEITQGFKFNLRFPGQYYDNETNLNYNINRDYNPAWGRYIQSDPLGLNSGINTYGYVNGNSLSYSDPLGLMPVEHYLNKWICKTNNWEQAFVLAYKEKFGPFDPKDTTDSDNRTAAEHYIFGRMLGSSKTPIELRAIYLLSGSYLSIGYQISKKIKLKKQVSPASFMQLTWELRSYTDSIKLTNNFDKNNCNCKGN